MGYCSVVSQGTREVSWRYHTWMISMERNGCHIRMYDEGPSLYGEEKI
jgi:hypothetical protein